MPESNNTEKTLENIDWSNWTGDVAEWMWNISVVGMAVVDPHSGKFLKVNPTFTNMLGYSEDHILEMTWKDITDPKYALWDQKEVNKVLLGKQTRYTMFKRYIRADGSGLPVELTVTAWEQKNKKALFFLAQIVPVENTSVHKVRLTSDEEEGMATYRFLTRNWKWIVVILAIFLGRAFTEPVFEAIRFMGSILSGTGGS